jgi:hypothetical protein
MHNANLAVTVYRHQLKLCMPDPESLSTVEYVGNALAEMKPRDPLEQMLMVQALWAHARVARLSLVANQQTGLQQIRTINDAADRASNTFRRPMLALA